MKNHVSLVFPDVITSCLRFRIISSKFPQVYSTLCHAGPVWADYFKSEVH